MLTIVNTDSVSAVSKGMNTLTDNVDTVMSSVNGYDVSTTDFDFAGAKNAIAKNIESIKTKVKNTHTLLDTVVSLHEELQESAEELLSADDSSSDSGARYASDYSGANSYSSGGNRSGYSYDTGGSSSGSSSSGVHGPSSIYTVYGGTGDGYETYTQVSLGSNIDSEKAIEVPKTEKEIDPEKTTEPLAGYVDAIMGKNAITEATKEEVKEVINNANVAEIEANKLAEEIKTGMCVVVEALSSDLDTPTYLKVVTRVAADYKAAVKYVKLDDIIQYKTNGTGSEVVETTKNAVGDRIDNNGTVEQKSNKENKVDAPVNDTKQTNETSGNVVEEKIVHVDVEPNTYVEANMNNVNGVQEKAAVAAKAVDLDESDFEIKMTEDTATLVENIDEKDLNAQEQVDVSDNQVQEIVNGDNSKKINVVVESEAELISNAKTEIKPEEKVYVEKETDSKVYNENRKVDQVVESLNYSIKDSQSFKSLNSVKFAEGVEQSFETSPITLFVKNNVVMSCKNGVLTETQLRVEFVNLEKVPSVN